MNAAKRRLKTFWIFVYENSTSWHFQDFVSLQLAKHSKHLDANAFELPDLLFDSNHGYIFVVLRLIVLPMRITRQLGCLKDLGKGKGGERKRCPVPISLKGNEFIAFSREEVPSRKCQLARGNFVAVRLGLRDSALRIGQCHRAEQAAT